jgi:hypothetical protein
MFFLGCFQILRRQHFFAYTSILSSIVWGILSFSVISYFHGGGYEYWGQYPNGSQNGLVGIVESIMIDPFSSMVQYQKTIPMTLEIFGSVGFIPFIWPAALFPLIPSFMAKLLSQNLASMNSFHYSAVIIPVSIVSTLYVFHIRRGSPVIIRRMALYWFIMAIFTSYYYGFLYQYRIYAPMTLGRLSSLSFVQTGKAKTIRGVLSTIPDNLTVSCQYQICPHIQRKTGDILPIPSKTSLDVVLFDVSFPLVLTTGNEMKKYIENMVMPEYHFRKQYGTFFVFSKKPLLFLK